LKSECSADIHKFVDRRSAGASKTTIFLLFPGLRGEKDRRTAMPLDTSEFAFNRAGPRGGDDLASLRPISSELTPDGPLGVAFQIAREGRGLSIADVALATRIRSAHLRALEASDLAQLPSRPFTIGYVRAYARALGVDPEDAVARFRAETPEPDNDLRAPVGHRWAPRRFGWAGAAALLIVTAVLGWNVARHARSTMSRPGVLPASFTSDRAPDGPAQLGAPLPPPPEAASPPAYVTPGLAAANATPDATTPGEDIGEPFVQAGAIYGVSNGGPGLILQAKKPTTLIIRGASGAVYFARVLAAGEAWRAPTAVGLTADVDDPASVMVFVHGASKGVLSDPKTPLSKLAA